MTTPSRKGMERAKKLVLAFAKALEKCPDAWNKSLYLENKIAIAIDKAVAEEREFAANLALIAGQTKLAEAIRNREAHK